MPLLIRDREYLQYLLKRASEGDAEALSELTPELIRHGIGVDERVSSALRAQNLPIISQPQQRKDNEWLRKETNVAFNLIELLRAALYARTGERHRSLKSLPKQCQHYGLYYRKLREYDT